MAFQSTPIKMAQRNTSTEDGRARLAALFQGRCTRFRLVHRVILNSLAHPCLRLPSPLNQVSIGLDTWERIMLLSVKPSAVSRPPKVTKSSPLKMVPHNTLAVDGQARFKIYSQAKAMSISQMTRNQKLSFLIPTSIINIVNNNIITT